MSAALTSRTESADEPAYNVQLLSDHSDDTMRAEDSAAHRFRQRQSLRAFLMYDMFIDKGHSICLQVNSCKSSIDVLTCSDVSIVPMQDDLVFLPSKVAKGFGEISPLLLCTRVSSALVLTDPATLRSVQIEVRT